MNLDLLYSKTLTSMREAGYAENTLNGHRSVINVLQSLMEESSITDYTEEVGEFFLPKLQEHYSYFGGRRMCKAVIGHLKKTLNNEAFQAPRGKRPMRKICNFKDYEQYLAWCGSKKLAHGTLKNYNDIVILITDYMESVGIHSAREITARNVIEFCQTLDCYEQPHRHNVVFVLRNSLLYFREAGLTDRDLAGVIPTVRFDHKAKLPSVYTDEEIGRMLENFDLSTAIGKRNYAIVLLVRYTGMRSTDATSLKFSQIDWENDRIDIVPRKTGNVHQVFPLYPDLGEAIKDYIFNGRPVSSEDYVFLTHVSPYGKMAASTFGSIVHKGLWDAGINTDGRKTGPHALRHSLATSMLQKGKTITDVAKVLNHSSIQTTTIYAKVDTSSLANCPLDVPGYRSSTEFDIDDRLGIPVVGKLAHYIADYIGYQRAMGMKASADERHLRNFSRFSLGYDLSASLIPEKMVEEWGMRRDCEKPNSHYARMRTLRRFAIYLSNLGEDVFIPDAASSGKQWGSFRPHIFSDDELSAFFAAADTLPIDRHSRFYGIKRYFSTLFRLLLGCGLRITEALNLLASDINPETAAIHIRVAKNDKERLVVMSKSLADEVSAYLSDNGITGNQPVFGLNNGRITDDGLIYEWYRKILKGAGIEHRGKDYGPRVHDFRHTFAVRSLTKMLSDGMPFYSALPVLRDYLGHSSIAATEKYLHLVEWMYPELVSKMNDISNQVIPEMEVPNE